jgi:two-component system, NtrC family, response regulator HydG
MSPVDERRAGFERRTGVQRRACRSEPLPGDEPLQPRDAQRDTAGARLSVVAISAAFGEFWDDLAADLGVTVDLCDPAAAVEPRPGAVALIVAAGGAEREAMQWLLIHEIPPALPVLVVGTDPGRRTGMQLVARGASDYFALPADLEIFRNAVAGALSRSRARITAPSNGRAGAFAPILGESAAIKHVLARAVLILPHRNASALIVGETGTGKELLARAIHAGGARGGSPFVAVNCSALPEHLIESELFGHERGAFTDAHAAKPGLFEVADTGTLFLDEISDLPLSMQAKLLRVLEDKQIRRVGGTKTRTVDVRILAATHEHFWEQVRQGGFREDLFFRLSTVVLRLPPLRERGDDLILVAQALLERLAADHGLPAPTLTPEIRRQLGAHTWPGNVRELKHALERALLLSPPGQLAADELLPPTEPPVPREGEIPFPAPLHEIATAAARATVKLCGGNRSESARWLRISPRRLRRLLNGSGDVAPDLEDPDEEADEHESV